MAHSPEFLPSLSSRRVSRRTLLAAMVGVGAFAAACSSEPEQRVTTFETEGTPLPIISGEDLESDRSKTLNQDFKDLFTAVSIETLGNQLGVVHRFVYNEEVLDIEFDANRLLRLQPFHSSPDYASIMISIIRDDGYITEEFNVYNDNPYPSFPNDPPEPERPIIWVEHPRFKSGEQAAVTVKEWVDFKKQVTQALEQTKTEKKAEEDAFAEDRRGDWQNTYQEFITEYNRLLLEANKEPFVWKSSIEEPSESNFNGLTHYISGFVRKDEGQTLIMQNFFFNRNPELVDVNNPTTKTIWIDDGRIKGTILIDHASSDIRWFQHNEHPRWTPLSSEEMKRVTKSMQEIFKRAKLKREL